MIKVKRALISVSDKTGLIDFVKKLNELGVEIISTGGTARSISASGVPVKEVSDYTGFPEILDGRVKTLHPTIHGGLLALRDKPSHVEQLKKHKIPTIDMVVVNLYPFEKVTQRNVSLNEALENIDIGGPSMLRSAAKNYKSVAVVCNPDRYKEITSELKNNSGLLSDSVLMSLAVEVFQRTANYDSIIHNYLDNRVKGGDFSDIPREVDLRFKKIQDLRYGENPHQAASFYGAQQNMGGLAKIKQLHGKELSFNNFLDLNAAVSVVSDFDLPCAVVIKHNNPTGVSEDSSLSVAYKQAWECDKLSAFGGIIGLNRNVDQKTAKLISESGFMECVIAPGYAKGALKLLTKKKNLRVVELNFKELNKGKYNYKHVDGGLLLQERDAKKVTKEDIQVVTKKKPSAAQIESLLFGWRVVKHIRSNAIILVKGKKTVGIGCGQTSRVESVKIAISKAKTQVKNSFLVSDAFIPKKDNIDIAKKAGIKVIIQTGGSIADQEVIKACDKAGIAMVTTGVRHFKH